MIQKSKLVRALMAVAGEYNENCHKLSMQSCPVCVLFRDNEKYGLNACGECLMRQAFKACGRRQCKPLECFISYTNGKKYASKEHLNQLEAVKEFYYKTISRIRRMTVKELNEPNAFDFLQEIDRKVGEKYGILREVTRWNEYE